ncbi:hypothetical protein MJO29_011554 [Puccinia striiformis f. sp. tritici]|nr:hypothetical protein MJO29_011554 [Puccinia striiformis f. sp. tritici]
MMEAVFGKTLTNYLFKFININRNNQNTEEEQQGKEEGDRGQEPEHEPIAVEEHQEIQQKQPIPVIPTSFTKPKTQDEQQQPTTTTRFTRKTTTRNNQKNRTLYLGPGISNSAKSSRTETQNKQPPNNNKQIKLTSTNQHQQQQQPQPQTPQAIKPNPSTTIDRFKKGTPIQPSPLRNVTTVTSSPPTPKQNINNTPLKKRKAGCSSIMNSVMKEVNLELQSRAPSPSPIKPSKIINPYSVLQRPMVRLNNRTSNHTATDTTAHLIPNPNINHQKLRKRKIQSCLGGTAITDSLTSVNLPPTNPMENILQQTMPKEYQEEEHQDKKVAKTRQVGKLPDRLIKKQKLLEEKKKRRRTRKFKLRENCLRMIEKLDLRSRINKNLHHSPPQRPVKEAEDWFANGSPVRWGKPFGKPSING